MVLNLKVVECLYFHVCTEYDILSKTDKEHSRVSFQDLAFIERVMGSKVNSFKLKVLKLNQCNQNVRLKKQIRHCLKLFQLNSTSDLFASKSVRFNRSVKE